LAAEAAAAFVGTEPLLEVGLTEGDVEEADDEADGDEGDGDDEGNDEAGADEAKTFLALVGGLSRLLPEEGIGGGGGGGGGAMIELAAGIVATFSDDMAVVGGVAVVAPLSLQGFSPSSELCGDEGVK
jgi:hypothetical protein